MSFSTKQARILEVFSSLQGEGIRLGERQVFVRFGGCNVCCDYCDEPDSIPLSAGSLWNLKDLQSKILQLNEQFLHKSISWTGGEPLLHTDFLLEALSWAKSQGFINYLETNGTLPARLSKVVDFIDLIAMDFKLFSATGRNTWPTHMEFLSVAPERCFVKVILTEASTKEEWIKAVKILRDSRVQIPLVLQPATPVPSTRQQGIFVRPISPRRALEFLLLARKQLKDVRLIPQWHPLWGLP